jgi:hypothetical protein
MAKKSREQYASQYAVLASAVRKYQKIVNKLGSREKAWRRGAPDGLSGDEKIELRRAKESLTRATEDAQKFRNDLNFNVPGGGVIWDYIYKTQKEIEDPSGLPPGRGPGTGPTGFLASGGRPPTREFPERFKNPGMPSESQKVDDEFPDAVVEPPTDPWGSYMPSKYSSERGYSKTTPIPSGRGFVSEDTPEEIAEEDLSGTTGPKFEEDMLRVEEYFKELDAIPPFTEAPPNMNDAKYRDAEGKIRPYVYQLDVDAYEQRAASHMQKITNIQFRIESLFTKLRLTPTERLTPDQRKKWSAAQDSLDELKRSNKVQEEELKNSRLGREKRDRDTLRLQESALELDRIRVLVEQGHLKLAAEAAAALNMREMRGQTLDFLESIANNPSALASLMSSEYGQKMLDDLGFGALAAGDTPQDFSRFFHGTTGGQAPGMAGEALTREEQEFALKVAMRGFEDPHQVVDPDTGIPVTVDGMEILSGPTRQEEELRFGKNILGQQTRTYEMGSVRKHEGISYPNWSQWKQIVGAGQEKSFLFEAGLAGMSPAELMANMQSTRPGTLNYQAQYLHNRSRFR